MRGHPDRKIPGCAIRPAEDRRGGAVRLRDVREGDLPAFFEQQRDPEANEMAAFPAREREAFMAHWHKILRDESNVIRTVLFEGRVAGNVLCFMRGDEREVGYWLGREFWGKGIATRALTLFLRMVKTRPLYAGVAVRNAPSIRVLEKCGFVMSRREGDHHIMRLG